MTFLEPILNDEPLCDTGILTNLGQCGRKTTSRHALGRVIRVESGVCNLDSRRKLDAPSSCPFARFVHEVHVGLGTSWHVRIPQRMHCCIAKRSQAATLEAQCFNVKVH